MLDDMRPRRPVESHAEPDGHEGAWEDPGRFDSLLVPPGDRDALTGTVSFPGVTLRMDPDATITDSRFEYATRPDSHSLKPEWPNE